MCRFLRSARSICGRVLAGWCRLAGAVAAVLLLGGGGGEAVGRLEMRPDALTDEEWQVVRERIVGRGGEEASAPIIEWYMWKGVADTPEGVWTWLRRKMVHSTRVDLNGDGRPELVTLFDDSYFCGSAGCDGGVYAWNDHRLETVQGLILGGPSLCLSSRGPGGTPYLFSGSSALWWTDSGFEFLFINQDNSEILEVGPGERALIYAFREANQECYGLPDELPNWP